MNGAQALPYPADDPASTRGLAAGFDGQRQGINDTQEAITAHAIALPARWDGHAGPAAAQSLQDLANPLHDIACVLLVATPGLHAYADRLEEARQEITLLQQRWDEADTVYAATIGHTTDLALDEAGEWHARQAAVDQQATAHHHFRLRHAQVLDEVRSVPADLAGQLEDLVESWLGPIDRAGGATSALIEAHRGHGTDPATRVALELGDAVDEFHEGDLIPGFTTLADLRALLDAIHTHADDPEFAATILNVLGAARWLALPGVIARWIGTHTEPERQEVLAALDDLGQLLATASHTTTQTGGLSPGFVLDLTGIDLTAPPADDVAARDAELHPESTRSRTPSPWPALPVPSQR